MARQPITIGAQDAGDGDTLFTAFTKVEANFTELYSDDSADVNSIIEGTGISVNQATGDVTISLSDGAINEIKLQAINTPSDDMVLTYDSATGGFEWRFDYAASPDNSTIQFNGSGLLEVKDDGVSYAKMADEFTTAAVISASDVDFSSAQVFTKTLTGTTTLNFSNVQTGMVKDLVITGDFPFSLPPSVKTITGTYDGTVSNLIQIVSTNGATEQWASISQEA